ncbi:MAG: HAD-IA family hydrolase [Neisseria sp.]|nr:HAD-IA family hydrolase [Neisseria sp.]
MPVRLVIFDWDGTLVNSSEPIIQAMQMAFVECGLLKPSSEAIHALIGQSLLSMLMQLAPQENADGIERLRATYANHYLNPNKPAVPLFAEVIPCLNALKVQGFWLAVATSKGRNGLNMEIAHTQTVSFWLTTRCASECPPKPAPDMVLEICDELGVLPQETIVVGDTTYDLEMAANAGVRAVAVLTGAHDERTLQTANPLAILPDLSGLPAFLQCLNVE